MLSVSNIPAERRSRISDAPSQHIALESCRTHAGLLSHFDIDGAQAMPMLDLPRFSRDDQMPRFHATPKSHLNNQIQLLAREVGAGKLVN